jgi:hypothetical protein
MRAAIFALWFGLASAGCSQPPRPDLDFWIDCSAAAYAFGLSIDKYDRQKPGWEENSGALVKGADEFSQLMRNEASRTGKSPEEAEDRKQKLLLDYWSKIQNDQMRSALISKFKSKLLACDRAR